MMEHDYTPRLFVGCECSGNVRDAFLRSGLPRWANQTDSGQDRLGPSAERSAKRAETYPGVASAMAHQWGESLSWSVNM